MFVEKTVSFYFNLAELFSNIELLSFLSAFTRGLTVSPVPTYMKKSASRFILENFFVQCLTQSCDKIS